MLVGVCMIFSIFWPFAYFYKFYNPQDWFESPELYRILIRVVFAPHKSSLEEIRNKNRKRVDLTKYFFFVAIFQTKIYSYLLSNSNFKIPGLQNSGNRINYDLSWQSGVSQTYKGPVSFESGKLQKEFPL